MPKPEHVTQEAWDKAQELLVSAPGKWTHNICAGAFITPKGELADNCLNGYICHAFVSRGDYHSKAMFFNTMKNIKETCEIAFLDWLKNKSPVRKYILNEDVKSMCHGGVMIDCRTIRSDTLLWICKMCRLPYEDTWRLPIWYDLVQRGVYPMLALCVSQCVTPALADYKSTTHNTCMIPPKTKAELKRLFEDHVLDRVGNASAGWETSGVFSSGNRYLWDEHLLPIPKYGQSKTKKVPDGWGGFIEKSIPCSVDTLADDLLKLQKEYI